MATRFRPAPQVAAVARDLIRQHHRHLNDLECRVEYLFVDPAPTKHGKTVLGYARKLTGLPAYLARREDARDHAEANAPLFLIVISHDEWARLGDAGRAALVDHELMHLWAEQDEETEEVTLSLRGHDTEEFTEIVTRHGLWLQDLREMAEAIEAAPQLRLFDTEAAA